MEGSRALSGATDGTSRDGGEPSRVVVESFFGKERMVPQAHGALMTPVRAFFSGEMTFSLELGELVSVWTDARGIDAIIETCLAAKVRAEIAGADLRPLPRSFAPPLDPIDVPF